MAGAAEEWTVAARVECADGRPAWIVQRCGGETVAECSREGEALLVARLPLVLRELLHRVLQLEEVWWRLNPHGDSERLRQSILSCQRLLHAWIAGGCRSPGIAAAIEAGLMDEQAVAAVRPDGEASTPRLESARLESRRFEHPFSWPLREALVKHPEATVTDLLVDAYLGSFRRAGKTAMPSAATIAREIRRDRRSVQRAIAHLQQLGYIAVQHRFSKNGDDPEKLTPKSSIYRLTIPECALSAEGGDTGVTTPTYSTSTNILPNGKDACASSASLTYQTIYGAWREAWQRHSAAPYTVTPQDQRDVTAALKLGTLCGLDLARFFKLAIRWLTTRKEMLTVSLRAAINNAPAIQHDLGSCELKPQKIERKLDPRVAKAVEEANRIHRKAGCGGGEGEADGERGSGSSRAAVESAAGGV